MTEEKHILREERREKKEEKRQLFLRKANKLFYINKIYFLSVSEKSFLDPPKGGFHREAILPERIGVPRETSFAG